MNSVFVCTAPRHAALIDHKPGCLRRSWTTHTHCSDYLTRQVQSVSHSAHIIKRIYCVSQSSPNSSTFVFRRGLAEIMQYKSDRWKRTSSRAARRSVKRSELHLSADAGIEDLKALGPIKNIRRVELVLQSRLEMTGRWALPCKQFPACIEDLAALSGNEPSFNAKLTKKGNIKKS